MTFEIDGTSASPASGGLITGQISFDEASKPAIVVPTGMA